MITRSFSATSTATRVITLPISFQSLGRSPQQPFADNAASKSSAPSSAIGSSASPVNAAIRKIRQPVVIKSSQVYSIGLDVAYFQRKCDKTKKIPVFFN